MSGFQFKRFYLVQNNCAMKVGTDGVLLGAWADISNCKNILDVGAGTGLIALMLRQRAEKLSQINTKISALEIDKAAFLQAKKNFNNSPWSDISINHGDFNTFEQAKQYDLVVSNPPYFVNSLKSPDQARNKARHTCSLSFESLINQFCNITNEEGRLALVLPLDALNEIKTLAQKFSLTVSKLVYVYTKEGKAAKRILMELSKMHIKQECSELIIHHKGGYSQSFINLTKDFYLKM
ncbi:tRNA1(Val) (adenine(37)-N6)-methyltransferase [Pseudoalteromonas denitrificans]|uniref:tRNA1(Val) (adenine(37)-N6)-methyltransferase n=1 Tax=Pseudoalteromonas denitrificans DSM 6059 TaxID=1123010 RepID=A0A1I1IMS7_9GAMM|nr:methyltransferase [Pseudoalteromonas denitrificans]SFC37609.1 tRNA1Val (adenine37-N6)-methyltransferase [Pseudoalteromonas denitrificans DSM 6059]